MGSAELTRVLDAILAPLVLSGLASVVTICGIAIYVAVQETTRRLASMLGAVHTVLWLVVLQQFYRFVETQLISWVLVLVMILEVWWLARIIGHERRLANETLEGE